MRIAKLILHYNTPALTKELCRMIPDAIVIDNGSDILMSDLTDNLCIRFQENLGFTPNWNRAIKTLMANDADYYDAFWLMNSDITITQESINRIQKLMEVYHFAMITPSYNCWMKQCRNQGSTVVRQVKCIEFTAPIISRVVFDMIGYFDETFERGYGVEFDWSIRMAASGLKQYCDDQSAFHHIGQQTISAIGTLENYEQAAKQELADGMIRKYGEQWRELLYAACNVTFGPSEKKKVAVYTTIFGKYSYLYPMPKQSVPADYFCLTDNFEVEHGTVFGQPGEGEQWKNIPLDFPSADLPHRTRAKFFKLFPWETPYLDQYEIVIFIDGSISVTSPDFIRFCIDSMGDSDMALYQHPQRDCIYEEGEASKPLVKYQDQNIDGQLKYYRSMYPDHGGLYACGVMVRRQGSAAMRNLMSRWWWEIIKWTYQDQLSFPVVCRLSKFIPALLPGNQYSNPYFKVNWHDDNQKPKRKGGQG